jgi:hypothetical protein
MENIMKKIFLVFSLILINATTAQSADHIIVCRDGRCERVVLNAFSNQLPGVTASSSSVVTVGGSVNTVETVFTTETPRFARLRPRFILNRILQHRPLRSFIRRVFLP